MTDSRETQQVPQRRRSRLRDRVQVVRADGSKTEWEFPKYGDALPHDLVHFIVEQELARLNGFWGPIDDGAEVVFVHDQAILSHSGEALCEPAVNLSQASATRLIEAKAARCTAPVRMARLRRMLNRCANPMTDGVASIHGNQDTSSVPKISHACGLPIACIKITV